MLCILSLLSVDGQKESRGPGRLLGPCGQRPDGP